MRAAAAGRTGVVELLLAGGARASLRDEDGQTARSLALARGHADTAARLETEGEGVLGLF
jgi:ankyrin repeat protein